MNHKKTNDVSSGNTEKTTMGSSMEEEIQRLKEKYEAYDVDYLFQNQILFLKNDTWETAYADIVTNPDIDNYCRKECDKHLLYELLNGRGDLEHIRSFCPFEFEGKIGDACPDEDKQGEPASQIKCDSECNCDFIEREMILDHKHKFIMDSHAETLEYKPEVQA